MRGSVRTGPRILLLILLIIVLVFGGLLWFDYLGFMDVKDTLSPVVSLITRRRRTQVEQLERPGILEEQRMAKQWEALDLRAEELDRREETVSLREAELEEMIETLKEREKSHEEREKSFNTRVNLYENKRANLEQNARYLNGMPPEDAVSILMNMEDQVVIDHLRTAERLAQEAGDQSIVSYWLSLIARENPERAAEIQRKMARRPSG
ncbi:MAG: periplasmic-type flagellar collar protein FlbB [Spirochaetia bacterium]